MEFRSRIEEVSARMQKVGYPKMGSKAGINEVCITYKTVSFTKTRIPSFGSKLILHP